MPPDDQDNGSLRKLFGVAIRVGAIGTILVGLTGGVEAYDKWAKCGSSLRDCLSTWGWWLVCLVSVVVAWLWQTEWGKRAIAWLSPLPTPEGSSRAAPPPNPALRTAYLEAFGAWLDARSPRTPEEDLPLALRFVDTPDAVASRVEVRGQHSEHGSLRGGFMRARQRLLVLGNPGTGKSTSLLKLAGQLLRDARSDASAPMPVWIDLPALCAPAPSFPLALFSRRRAPGKDLPTRLIAEVARFSRRFHSKLDVRWVRDTLLSRSFVVFLDGLDEVPCELRAGLVHAVNEYLLDAYGELSIVVACRADAYRTLVSEKGERLRLDGALRIEELDAAAVAAVLREHGRAEIARDAGLTALLTTPLALALTLRGGERDPMARRAERSTLAFRGALLDEFIRGLHGRSGSNVALDDLRQLLGWLARQMSLRGQVRAPVPGIATWQGGGDRHAAHQVSKHLVGLLLGAAVLAVLQMGLALPWIVWLPSSLLWLAVTSYAVGSGFDPQKPANKRLGMVSGTFVAALCILVPPFSLAGVGFATLRLTGLEPTPLRALTLTLPLMLLAEASEHPPRSRARRAVAAAAFAAIVVTLTAWQQTVDFGTLAVVCLVLGAVGVPHKSEASMAARALFFTGHVLACALVLVGLHQLFRLVAAEPARELASACAWLPLALYLTAISGRLGTALLIAALPGGASLLIGQGAALAALGLAMAPLEQIVRASVLSSACACVLVVAGLPALERVRARWLDDPFEWLALRARRLVPRQSSAVLNEALRLRILRRDNGFVGFAHVTMRDHFAVRGVLGHVGSEATTKITAARELGELGEAGIEPLIVLSDDANLAVRQAAAEALASCGAGLSLIERVLEHRAPSNELLICFRKTFAKVDDGAKPQLAVRALERAAPAARAVVYDAFDPAWDADVRRAFGISLPVALAADDPRLRAAALKAMILLHRNFQPEALVVSVPQMLEHLNDPDNAVREGAVLALDLAGHLSSRSDTPLPEAAELEAHVLRRQLSAADEGQRLSIARNALGSARPDVRAQAIAAILKELRKASSPEAKDGLEALCKALENPLNGAIMGKWLHVLSLEWPARVREALAPTVLRLATDGSGEAQTSALLTVRHFATCAHAAEVLIAALSQREARDAASCALREFDEESVVQRVAAIALRTGDAAQLYALDALVRRWGAMPEPALSALARLVKRFTTLRGRLREAWLWRTRASAYQSVTPVEKLGRVLGETRDPRVVPLALRLLAHGDAWGRCAAARALRTHCAHRSVQDGLLAALADSESAVVANALTTLEQCGDRAHLDAFRVAAAQVRRRHPRLAELADGAVAQAHLRLAEEEAHTGLSAGHAPAAENAPGSTGE